MCSLSVQLYSDVRKCQLSIVSDKIINNSDNFGIKCSSYSKISAILCFCFWIFCFYTFLILKNMLTNRRKCCIPCYIWHLWRHVQLVHFSVATYCTCIYIIKQDIYIYVGHNGLTEWADIFCGHSWVTRGVKAKKIRNFYFQIFFSTGNIFS